MRNTRSNVPSARGFTSTGKIPSRLGRSWRKVSSAPAGLRRTSVTTPSFSGAKPESTVTWAPLVAAAPATSGPVSAKTS